MHFLELHSARSSGGMGPSPITYQDIAAWSGLTGERISAFGVSCIRRLDNVWRNVVSERQDG